MHSKFIRDGKELCNTMKIRTKASTRTSYRDHSAADAFRRAEDQVSATSRNGICEDELRSPPNMPIEMSLSFTSIMSNHPPIGPSLCRQKKMASTEMKKNASSSLNFLELFPSLKQIEQQSGSSFFVASIADDSAYTSSGDVDMSSDFYPMLPTSVRAPQNKQDVNKQTDTISFLEYDRIFHEPLSDDLEPKHFPHCNSMRESRTIGLGVIGHMLSPPADVSIPEIQRV